MGNRTDDLFWRDEILQILYWLRGEGLAEAASLDDLLTFLSAEEGLIRVHLEQLVCDGYAACTGGTPGRYRLTEMGLAEGGRRFAEEFAELTHQGHGECNDPDCFCKTLGPQACTLHAAHDQRSA